ncbi:MAG: molybdopterin-binding protein [Candidatus Sumerlaeia bacterium]|nr:molybdopterin-binding protein [Candidatus Sumerlaeia bacterium]
MNGKEKSAQGTLVHVCVGAFKGQPKQPVERAVLRANYGIEGDAHAGAWHRQVSLLDIAAIESLAVRDSAIVPGVFGENLALRGIDLNRLGLGSVLRIGGEAELKICQIGKDCHTGCDIQKRTGNCIMPRAGVFAKVTRSGEVRPGDPVALALVVSRDLFQAVVLVASDRCASGLADDTAGPAVIEMLQATGRFHVYRRKVVHDDVIAIGDSLRHYSDGHGIDLVLTVGGTGLSPRDVTPEATRSLIERPTPGLDEAMRAASLQKTPHAMLSRGVSGIRKNTLIVNLPGSKRAATENLAVILPALPHALEKLRGSPADCDSARGKPQR